MHSETLKYNWRVEKKEHIAGTKHLVFVLYN